MTLINMTKGNYEGEKSKVRLKGDGDTDASIKAMNSGFFIARVKLLENVKNLHKSVVYENYTILRIFQHYLI